MPKEKVFSLIISYIREIIRFFIFLYVMRLNNETFNWGFDSKEIVTLAFNIFLIHVFVIKEIRKG